MKDEGLAAGYWATYDALDSIVSRLEGLRKQQSETYIFDEPDDPANCLMARQEVRHRDLLDMMYKGVFHLRGAVEIAKKQAESFNNGP